MAEEEIAIDPVRRLLSNKSSEVYEKIIGRKDFHELRQESIILALQALKIAVVFNRISENEREILHGQLINGEPFDTFILNKLSLAERVSLEEFVAEVTSPDEILKSATAYILDIDKEIQDLNAETLLLKHTLSNSSKSSARTLSGNSVVSGEKVSAVGEPEDIFVTSEEQKDATLDELQVGISPLKL